jgi:SAM-dependent methyltransferase
MDGQRSADFAGRPTAEQGLDGTGGGMGSKMGNEILAGPPPAEHWTPAWHKRRRNDEIRALSDRLAGDWDLWRKRNYYFHAATERYLRFLVSPGRRILELGCATGSLLAALRPSFGVGIDISTKMIEIARAKHPELTFIVGDAEDAHCLATISGPFDIILMVDTIGSLDDLQSTFANLHPLCNSETRIIVAYHSHLWEPILRTAERLGLKSPSVMQNWLSSDDISAILALADFEEIQREWCILVPKRLLGLGTFINRFIAPLPIIRRLCVRNFGVFRSRLAPIQEIRSATVIIPCRNERGNIEAAVNRIPQLVDDLEILFVEGHSSDGTLVEIHRVIANYPHKDIKVVAQDGSGKGDAVRKGMTTARGDVIVILDADLTLPPEELPKFLDALASGKGEFVNGSRLVYPLEKQSMRYLNFIANVLFSKIFSFILNQRITDTLCGTKVFRKRHYQRIAEDRLYFGDFDPFGDFDLIFGATKQSLKFIEVPIRYAARRYGETNISRFRHGWLLAKMVVFSFRKLKAF